MSRRSVCTNYLALVNPFHPVSLEAEPEQLTEVAFGGGVTLERQASLLLGRLLEDIGAFGQIAVVSGWRSEEAQSVLERAVRQEQETHSRRLLAAPGFSEHQTGLAVDLCLVNEKVDGSQPVFPYSGIAQIFRSNAARYGFIQRYPSGKRHITGFSHNPWHFRYVGVPHAEIISNLAITLEEYLEMIWQHPAGNEPFLFQSSRYAFEITYLSQEDAKSWTVGNDPMLLSCDNCGGVVRTVWKNKEG